MIFDLSFLKLELEAAGKMEISKELLSHPAFKALADHEAALQRPVWDEESFRDRFAAAATEEPEDWSDWGLAPLFHDREKLENMKHWLETEQDALTKQIDEWIACYTEVPQRDNLRCVVYVGSYDGGFSPDVGSGLIYLNLPVFSCKESFLETLVHESYHARRVSEETFLSCKRMADDENLIKQILFSTFEEGIATFVGYNGSTTTQYVIIPMRTPEEGSEELKQLMQRYKRKEMTEQEVFDSFIQSDCCYTCGIYIANSVWENSGIAGLDLWSSQADLRAYYEAFRSTPQGAEWPELEL